MTPVVQHHRVALRGTEGACELAPASACNGLCCVARSHLSAPLEGSGLAAGPAEVL